MRKQNNPQFLPDLKDGVSLQGVMKENINALTMLVDAENRQAAYKIAEQANTNLFKNPDAYIYLEDLGCEEWLVILASNEDNAKQARQKFFADSEWED